MWISIHRHNVGPYFHCPLDGNNTFKQIPASCQYNEFLNENVHWCWMHELLQRWFNEWDIHFAQKRLTKMRYCLPVNAFRGNTFLLFLFITDSNLWYKVKSPIYHSVVKIYNNQDLLCRYMETVYCFVVTLFYLILLEYLFSARYFIHI